MERFPTVRLGVAVGNLERYVCINNLNFSRRWYLWRTVKRTSTFFFWGDPLCKNLFCCCLIILTQPRGFTDGIPNRSSEVLDIILANYAGMHCFCIRVWCASWWLWLFFCSTVYSWPIEQMKDKRDGVYINDVSFVIYATVCMHEGPISLCLIYLWFYCREVTM